jgi:endogenous inhibitor of DNA gyrase (YacG/DUF329 family)
MSNKLKVNCPTCNKEVEWIEVNAFRPFCSERCKQIDLGAWASEEYAIAAEEQDEWSLAEATSAESASDKQALH